MGTMPKSDRGKWACMYHRESSLDPYRRKEEQSFKTCRANVARRMILTNEGKPSAPKATTYVVRHGLHGVHVNHHKSMIFSKKRRFHQGPLTEWPPHVYYGIGILRQEPDELQEKHGIVFTDTADDLDAFKAALIVVPSDYYFVLKRRAHSPGPGTPVLVDHRIKDKSDHFRKFKAALGYRDRDFLSIDESVEERRWMNRLKNLLIFGNYRPSR